MRAFLLVRSKSDSFHHFSAEHLTAMALIAVCGLFLVVFRNSLRDQGIRRLCSFFLAAVLCVGTALQHVLLVYKHAWSVKRDLPLQLSDLAVILAAVMLLLGSDKLFQFMYFAGIGSSVQAILTPDFGKLPFPGFQHVQFFVSHGGVVLACLFMVLAFHYRPTIRCMWMTILILNIYAACVFLLNRLLQANYLYLIRKPRSDSLLDYLGSWPWYLVSLELVMVLSFYILYVPFWIMRKKREAGAL